MPQDESLVQPQGEPRESNRGVPTDHIGWEGNLADANSIATSVFTDEPQGESLVQPQGESLVQPQGEPRESNRGVPTDRIGCSGRGTWRM